MGKMAPPPPDYAGAAQQQGAASQANVGTQTQANRPNQNTGFASSQWHQDPYTGQWTQSVGLTGALGGAQGEAEQALQQALGQPIDNGSAARDKAVSSMYGAETAQLDPQWRLAQEQNQAQLANQGLDPTSAAARAQNNQLNQAQGQAYSQAMSNAQQLGNQAQDITFRQNMAARQEPLQELSGMLGLEAQPGFQGAGLAQAPEYLAAALGLGNYGLQANQMNNQLMGAAGQGLGSILGGAGNLAPFILG